MRRNLQPPGPTSRPSPERLRAVNRKPLQSSRSMAAPPSPPTSLPRSPSRRERSQSNGQRSPIRRTAPPPPASSFLNTSSASPIRTASNVSSTWMVATGPPSSPSAASPPSPTASSLNGSARRVRRAPPPPQTRPLSSFTGTMTPGVMHTSPERHQPPALMFVPSFTSAIPDSMVPSEQPSAMQHGYSSSPPVIGDSNSHSVRRPSALMFPDEPAVATTSVARINHENSPARSPLVQLFPTDVASFDDTTNNNTNSNDYVCDTNGERRGGLIHESALRTAAGVPSRSDSGVFWRSRGVDLVPVVSGAQAPSSTSVVSTTSYVPRHASPLRLESQKSSDEFVGWCVAVAAAAHRALTSGGCDDVRANRAAAATVHDTNREQPDDCMLEGEEDLPDSVSITWYPQPTVAASAQLAPSPQQVQKELFPYSRVESFVSTQSMVVPPPHRARSVEATTPLSEIALLWASNKPLTTPPTQRGAAGPVLATAITNARDSEDSAFNTPLSIG